MPAPFPGYSRTQRSAIPPILIYADFHHGDLRAELRVRMQRRGEEVRPKAASRMNGKVEKRTVSYACNRSSDMRKREGNEKDIGPAQLLC